MALAYTAMKPEKRFSSFASKGIPLLLVLLAAGASILVLQSPALTAPGSTPDAGVVQTDGRVSAILRVGDRVYLGGSFQHVNGVSRPRLAAIDADTGALTGWSPRANKGVSTLAASANGTRIYAGGDFTAINGVTRNRLAALDATTGDPVAGWGAAVGGTVRTIAVSGPRVYLGGDFLSVNGQARNRLAMVDATSGALSGDWRPNVNNSVRKLAVSDDGTRVYAGGHFTGVVGQSRRYLEALNPISGALISWNPGISRPAIDFVESGPRIFTAEGGPGGGATGAYDTATGVSRWNVHADGDCQTITFFQGRVYVGGHYDVLGGQTRRKFAAVDSLTGALDAQWAPRGDRGAWELTPDPATGRLYAGGEFTTINGQTRQRFARFSD